jgi:hypothetical protein
MGGVVVLRHGGEPQALPRMLKNQVKLNQAHGQHGADKQALGH